VSSLAPASFVRHRRARALSLTLVSATLLLAACRKDAPARATTASTPNTPSGEHAATSNAILLGERDVAQAGSRAVAAGVYVTGSLDPAEKVEIQSQIAGQLLRVLVDRGTVVRRGQVITTFESGALRAQVASAEAAVAARERDLVAADTLYKRGAASQQDFVNARVARDAARAQLAQAEETLQRANITAPIAGQVSEKLVASGEGVQSGKKLFTLVNTDALELAGQISASDAARVRVGQRVSLTLETYPGRTLVARVDRLDAVADPATRQVTVYIRFDNRAARERIVAGLFAAGRIETPTADSGRSSTTRVVTVPTVAVRTEGSESVVYTVAHDTLHRQVVTIGTRDPEADEVEIRHGLEAGATVLVAPGASPRDNTPVRMTRSDDRAKRATSTGNKA
jgi:RND family efflux transporter MFP subunit